MQDFKKLKVWKKSHELTLDVYIIARKFPKEEVFGLTSQLRRSCSSIGANIAEGCGKRTDADFCRYINNAFDSAQETENHFILAKDLSYLNENDFNDLEKNISEVKAMLIALIKKLNSN